MQHLKLKKYSRSTYKGEAILSVTLHLDGLVVLITFNHNEPFYIDKSEVYEGASADYILCILQNDININILK